MADRHCADCGYDLTGIALEPKKPVRCPECGSLKEPVSSAERFGRSLWFMSLGLGIIPIAPCWLVITSAPDGWGQIGALFVMIPIASIIGAMLGATGSAIARRTVPMSTGRRMAEWLGMAICVCVAGGAVGLAVGFGLYSLDPKGGC